MSRLPELFDRRVKARSLAYLFAAGAGLALGTIALPHGGDVSNKQLLLLAAVSTAIALFFILRAGHIHEWELHVGVLLGTALLSAGPATVYPIIYIWTALYSFYFFRLPWALVQVAAVAVAYTIVLAVQDPHSPVVHWVVAVGTPTVAGLLISRLLDRVRAEAGHGTAREQALRESESRTRLILDGAPDAFVAIDGEGRIVRWNAAAERLFAWSAAETIGRPVRDVIFTDESRIGFDQRREEMLASADPVDVRHVETELRRRDGSVFPAEETVSRVRIGDDVVTSAFIRDVSGRRRRQQEREVLMREQAARVEAERVADVVGRMQHLVDAALQHETLRAILADLVMRVHTAFGAVVATIWVIDEDADELEVGASSVATEGEPARTTLGHGLAGRVAEQRSPELLGHPDLEAEIVDPATRAAKPVSVMAAPLWARGRLSGVIQVGSPGHLTEEDLAMLQLAADRVALAIDQVRLYEREHRIAETLQRTLLPEKLPQMPGLAVAARYRPAASEAEVGGDWFDVLALPGGRIGLVMGDVAGKGLAAASMVGRLRSALRAYALEGHEPANVVDRLNRLVWTELEDSQMATLLFVVMDPAEGHLSWVNAGHLPPLLVNGSDTPEFLQGARSVPLGVMPFPSYEENAAHLAPGGSVVLYTDGLVERPGAHIDEGLSLLSETVGGGPSGPEELCDHLLARMVPPEGTSDDVALLALRSVPISDHFSVELPTEPEALASMRGMLRRWLRHARGTDSEIAEITTACGEAATNAIEHAGASGGAPFELEGSLEGGRVAIVVRDYGTWRPPRQGDQGRGLSLMRALMDEVEVTPSPEGTTVRLCRRLNGAGAEKTA